MKRFHLFPGAFLGIAALLGILSIAPASLRADLADDFVHPPDSARPWVYWFWINGNVTREGITADLEAMKRVGIGGVLIMEVDPFHTPAGPAAFGGSAWRDLFKFALSEADRLGLKVNMYNACGFEGSGGPWITPELSMQKVVWSETIVPGGQPFDGIVPRPPSVDNYYQDIALLAMPMPVGDDLKMADFSPVASTSTNDPKAGDLIDEKPATAIALPLLKKDPSPFIQIEFAKPFTAHALTMTMGRKNEFWRGEVQYSDDGQTFKPIAVLGEANSLHPAVEFSAVTGRYFRVVCTSTDASKPGKLIVAKLNLPASYRISNIDGKSLVSTEYPPPPQPATFLDAPPGTAIPPKAIVDLTAKMDQDGRLSWQAPEGKWLLLRFGHTTTGVLNHPADDTGLGLECDKFSQAAIEVNFQAFLAKLIADSPALSGTEKTLVSTHIDSWECGSQNWTPLMREEFQKRRGYDLLPFLPAFTGRVVGSVALTERFLWDLRQTASEMIVENYAGHLRTLANRKGLHLSIEAYHNQLNEVPANEESYGGQADEPMGEFWAWNRYWNAFSCTEMSSAAHIYGKRIVGGESFTSLGTEKWQGYPAVIKDLADWALCEGINRFVIHRYAMQPWVDRAPGMSMGPWGLHYERTETWWEQSKAWHEYLARCSYLLRQGLFVADVCYLEAEGSPRRFIPPPTAADPATRIRSGYNFDGCTPDALLARMSVKDGRLVLPDGMSYRALVLPSVETMTPALLRKVKELADAGATVIAAKRPLKAPGLTDYPQCDEEVSRLASELWDSGKVITGKSVERVLAEKGLPPDFQATANLRYTHRSTGDSDIYFVANPEEQPVNAEATFRVAGRQPELWHPDTGRMESAGMYREENGRTSVPLILDPHGSVFVIFRHKAMANPVVAISRDGVPLPKDASVDLSRNGKGGLVLETAQAGRYEMQRAANATLSCVVPPLPQPQEMTGPWQVRFEPGRGAPEQITLDRLISWSEDDDPGVKYFSGTAAYTKNFDVAPPLLGGERRLYLDLGDVQVMAEVTVNGKSCGELWKEPFRVDITDAVKPGANVLEVKVVNLWVNRMIGDQELPQEAERKRGGALNAWPQWLLDDKPNPTGRYAFSTWNEWPKGAPLLKSGLIGPVTLNWTARVNIPATSENGAALPSPHPL